MSASLHTDHPAMRLYFDRRDHELLGIVRDVLAREEVPGLRKLLKPYLNPHGIKEKAATRGLRFAYAVISLFRSLERGRADDRLQSLRSLHDEALYGSAGTLRRNTARVLVQIMKDLVREEDETVQLRLASDFRLVATGKPRVVAAQLRHYHLAEMPEQWNQVAFDDHVHDANTKGRKSATHLILDAWIKGLRRLTVIYYNHVPAEAARELLEAGEIMGICVRVGIEFAAALHGRYVRFIWTPRGFADAEQFLEFLSQPDMETLMAQGREVSAWQEVHVMRLLEAFNARHRVELNAALGLDAQPVSRDEFLASVGAGQASPHHLARCIHDMLLPRLRARAVDLRAEIEGQGEGARRARELLARMNALDIDAIGDRFLRSPANPDLPDPNDPAAPDAPDLLRQTPDQLLARLERIESGSAVTLNLSGLRAEDVLELLYGCWGMITHLEIFNFKDDAYGRFTDNARVMELQSALNSGNAVRLKKCIRSITAALDPGSEQHERLMAVLGDMDTLRGFYRHRTLRSRMGTDSTGGSCRAPGMGLVVRETLSRRARKDLDRTVTQLRVPVSMDVRLRRTYTPRPDTGSRCLLSLAPGLRPWFREHRDEWVVQGYSAVEPSRSNVRILGGMPPECGNGLLEARTGTAGKASLPSPRYLNTNIKNWLKILAGFVPAFLTFALTKDWWVLAYLGAFIWFGITGLRNVIQSVFGAGGLRRSPLLRWEEAVHWNRIADSLFWTGFSVPLLDWVVKTLFLDHVMGVTTATAPIFLYTVMAVVNGAYICTHNLLRGLQKSAAFMNIFRSVLSIPIAVAFNAATGGILGAAGVPAVDAVLQRWAAVISKLASDCVAGFIEGAADSRQYKAQRLWDYRGKLSQLYDTYARLELLFPRQDVLKIMESPRELMETVGAEAGGMRKILIVNALDMLYFWMCQPRAREVFRRLLAEMSQEERTVFLLSQYVLLRERDISQLFIDGLVGKNFSRALAFYLDSYRTYLEDIQKLAGRALLPGTGGPKASGPKPSDPHLPDPDEA